MKKLQLRTALVVLLSLGLASCNLRYQSGYNFNYQGATAKFRKQEDIPANIKSVRIEHVFGDVHIEPSTPGSRPNWRWELTTWAGEESVARNFLDQISLETYVEGERMHWTLQIPESPGSALKGIKSTLWLSVASDTAVHLENRHGDSFLKGLRGAVRTQLRHGDADYESMTGELNLEHAHGKVNMKDIQSGQLALAHGSLEASELHQPFRFDVQHSSMLASEVEAGLVVEAAHTKVKVNSIAGAFQFDGRHSELVLSGDPKSLDLQSAHGDLQVRSTGMQLNKISVEASHADFHLTLPSGYELHLNSNLEHGKANYELPSGAGGKHLQVDIQMRHGNASLLPAG